MGRQTRGCGSKLTAQILPQSCALVRHTQRIRRPSSDVTVLHSIRSKRDPNACSTVARTTEKPRSKNCNASAITPPCRDCQLAKKVQNATSARSAAIVPRHPGSCQCCPRVQPHQIHVSQRHPCAVNNGPAPPSRGGKTEISPGRRAEDTVIQMGRWSTEWTISRGLSRHDRMTELGWQMKTARKRESQSRQRTAFHFARYFHCAVNGGTCRARPRPCGGRSSRR